MLFPHQLCLFQCDLSSSGQREALFLLHSPLSCSLLILHNSAPSWAASNLSLHLLLLFLSGADSAMLNSLRECPFSWSTPVTGTQDLVSVLLKNSSESRYSHLLPLFLSCKLQMTSPFKACSFLKIQINVAGLSVHLIVFCLST